MKRQFSNLWSHNKTEARWKWGTAVTFTLGTGAALVLWKTKWQPLLYFSKWPASLDVLHQAVLLVSVFSLTNFLFLHWRDGKNPDIRGLRGRLGAPKPDPGDYVSPAISRMSIQSGLGAAAVGAISSLATNGCFKWLTLCMLGMATMLAMVSVLCYAHASRWTNTDSNPPADVRKDPKLRVRKDLLKKATIFDQLSWYTLTTGLIWAVALASTLLAICANFLLGFLLWIYYFEFDIPSQEGSLPKTTEEDAPKA